MIRVQSPIRLDGCSEPEPDIALVRRGPDYRKRHPAPEEVLLVIEVVDPSPERDTGAKRAIYSEAGIDELWVVDLGARRVEVSQRLVGTDYLGEAEHSEDMVFSGLVPFVRMELAELEW